MYDYISITLIFLSSFILSFGLTPLIRDISMKFNYVDYPSTRKVHAQPTPRTGGLAIFLAVFISCLLFYLLAVNNSFSYYVSFYYVELAALVSGAVIVFITGLIDDVKGLKAPIKLFLQSIASFMACSGGIRITSLTLPYLGNIDLGFFALPFTIFWFLLLINAMNMIDGLDGLSAGIGFIASITIISAGYISFKSSPSLTLAIIILFSFSGAILGFLKYNFHPASIFLGDSGSYFMGYLLAALGVIGSLKTKASISLIIPIIALAVPLCDATWSPIRRFVFGRRIFQADKDHLHHRLLKYGFDHRQTVLVLYGLSFIFGISAFIVAATGYEKAFIVLLSSGLGLLYFLIKLGYFNFINKKYLKKWLIEIADVFYLRRERRVFLGHRVAVSQSKTFEELWEKLCSTCTCLKLDFIELNLDERFSNKFMQNRTQYRKVLNGWVKDKLSDQNMLLHMRLVSNGMSLGKLILACNGNYHKIEPRFFSRVKLLNDTLTESLLNLCQREGEDQYFETNILETVSSHNEKTFLQEQHVIWQQGYVGKFDRNNLNNHKAGLVWFTGLSGSGKSTLAHQTELELHKKGIRCYVLDGDNIRHGISNNLGFSREDRFENIRRIVEVAKLFVDAGTIVLAAFISPYKDDRDYIRKNFNDENFSEIYVKCPIEECERRDPKGQYKQVRAGIIKNYTGIHSPYEEPANPDLVINTEKLDITNSIQMVLDMLNLKGFFAPTRTEVKGIEEPYYQARVQETGKLSGPLTESGGNGKGR
ncbi:MAG: adenylyl-sulfate kinase [Desulfobacteraceae bacterium]